jgi:3-isopropylmalate/(R)-2-methylmalate dehydratase large subunit
VAQTLYDKVWALHAVEVAPGEPSLLAVDLHLLHEVASPQAFAGLEAAGRPVRAPAQTLAMTDHSTPTEGQAEGTAAIRDPAARLQIETMVRNAARHGIACFGMGDPDNGIVHVVAPELGRTLPGMVIVCGDSHTSTHGAFGALAHGIGTSEVEHVLATHTLRQVKSHNLQIRFTGTPGRGTSAKDLALAMIAQIGAGGATNHVIEYTGDAVRALSMAGRMTLCNMSIEGGAKAGLVAPDETTFAYLRERAGLSAAEWTEAVRFWSTLPSDPGAWFDRVEAIDVEGLAPMVSWGTSPEQSITIDGAVPDPEQIEDPARREAARRALAYMGLAGGAPIVGTPIDVVFIGSCTNGRLEDLRAAAEIAAGRTVAAGVRALVVPGSGAVRRAAEAEGLDVVFRSAGFEWREPGCSMCLGMNPDRLAPGQRCASTSNRNFEGRQGRGGRTHLMSPAMAAHAAITGCISDVRDVL